MPFTFHYAKDVIEYMVQHPRHAVQHSRHKVQTKLAPLTNALVASIEYSVKSGGWSGPLREGCCSDSPLPPAPIVPLAPIPDQKHAQARTVREKF
ncbi:hypothetical protein L1887_18672 [Cichorium endivia]|nr:hypothetical protein L1887_18672 [Cichorium endivia]